MPWLLNTCKDPESFVRLNSIDFIWDFRLPFPSHLGRKKNGKISAKIHEIGENKGHFWIGNDSYIRP